MTTTLHAMRRGALLVGESKAKEFYVREGIFQGRARDFTGKIKREIHPPTNAGSLDCFDEKLKRPCTGSRTHLNREHCRILQ